MGALHGQRNAAGAGHRSAVPRGQRHPQTRARLAAPQNPVGGTGEAQDLQRPDDGRRESAIGGEKGDALHVAPEVWQDIL